MDETLDVLAGHRASTKPSPDSVRGDHLIVDGTLTPADRVKVDEPYYSQKHRQHGMNVQAIACPDGTRL